VATWSTFNDTESIIKYGIKSLNQKAIGLSTVFIDGGETKRAQWIHRATMKNLKFNTRYGEHGLKKLSCLVKDGPILTYPNGYVGLYI
jgi:acid phosphatase type 7